MEAPFLNPAKKGAQRLETILKPNMADFEAMTTKLIGKKTALFRPPYGEYNDTVITTARGLGYEVIQWDIDTVDTEWMTGS